MHVSSQPHRRLLVPIGLAIVLACEIGGVALARARDGGSADGRHGTAQAAVQAGSAAGSALGGAAREAAIRAGSSAGVERRAGSAPGFINRRVDTAHVRPGPNRGMVARPAIAET